MPILLIRIDDISTEFQIIPLNLALNEAMKQKYTHKKDGFLVFDRGGYLSHVVKAPKMSKNDWENLTTSMLTKIIRNIDYYVRSITEKEKELRMLYMQINVYEDEVDDLFRYIEYDSEDWIWNRIDTIREIISDLEKKRNNIKKSLEYVKSDKVVFEKDKEVNYEIQPLQLDNKKTEEC